jgi:hypothetical protein
MKKILYFIIFFLLCIFLPPSAHADFGSFTASNYFYNPVTHEIKTDVSNFSPNIDSSDFFYALSIANHDDSLDYLYDNNLHLLPTTTSFDITATVFNQNLPTDNTLVRFFILTENGNRYLSQEFEASTLFISPTSPTNKNDCKKDGWKTFTSPKFKNQGDCVSFVEKLKQLHL